MIFIFGTLVFLLLIASLLFVATQIYTNILHPGAIYYPTTPKTVTQMLKLGRVDPKDTLIDLGSGDGRILIAAARLGATAIGYEIDPLLVWRSRRLIRLAKIEKLATVRWKSFWQADFSQSTIIAVYLFPHLMDRLQKLLQEKIDHPIRLVANDYPFTHLAPTKNHGQVYLYRFNKPDKI